MLRKVIKMENYWEIDGNFWSKNKFPYDVAKELARTLSNCKNCIDCEWCRDCNNCIECDSCRNCNDCY